MKSTLKAIGKILLIVFAVLYVGLAIFVTACLLNFNDQGITVFGDASLVIVDEDFSKDYKKNDLLIVSKGKDNGASVKNGDWIFFYNPTENYVVNYAEVDNIYEVDGKYNYVIGNGYNVYSDYYIGSKVSAMHGLGGILAVLESQFGFLALIILPTMIAVVFEIYAIVIEIIEYKKEV